MFNTGGIDPLELFAELRAQCAQAAQLRAQVLDPARAEAMLAHLANGWARPPSHDLAEIEAMVDPNVLLDVADFIGMVTEDLREFFMLEGPMPPASGVGMEGLG
jgi:hypothetical protein